MSLIGKTVATYGRLDILVNNVGISGISVGSNNALEGWNRIIAVNQTSVFLGTKPAAEQMAKTGGARSSTSIPLWALSGASPATRPVTIRRRIIGAKAVAAG
jgi:NAD(P)-dependent dehydrogenase (short-subunit alcohol dehydrogenase family)